MNETVADIVREMREYMGVFAPMNAVWIDDFKAYADRIEAANEREVAVSKTETTTGNAAKMREALVELTDKVLDYLHNGLIQLPLPIEEANAKARAALSAPPRNCDIYKTEDEANTAWLALDDACDDALAPFGWLLAEAKEGGAK